jgi:hypothetical protein
LKLQYVNFKYVICKVDKYITVKVKTIRMFNMQDSHSHSSNSTYLPLQGLNSRTHSPGGVNISIRPLRHLLGLPEKTFVVFFSIQAFTTALLEYAITTGFMASDSTLSPAAGNNV